MLSSNVMFTMHWFDTRKTFQTKWLIVFSRDVCTEALFL